MPLALIARAAADAPDDETRLRHAVQFLAEAGAGFGAAYAFSRARADGRALSPALVETLLAVLRRGPSFGHWVRIVRECAVAAGPEARARLDAPAVGRDHEAFLAALGEFAGDAGPFGSKATGVRDAISAARGGGALPLLELMVVLRNRLYGHGHALPGELFEALATPALDAVSALVCAEPLLDGGWLGRVVARERGGEAGLGWERLSGTSARAEQLPLHDGIALGALYLVVPTEGRVFDLFPLVANVAAATERPSFGFFQRPVSRGPDGGNVQQVEYLDYLAAPVQSEAGVAATRDLLGLLSAFERAEQEAAASREAAAREEARRREAVNLVAETHARLDEVRSDAPRHDLSWLFAMLSECEQRLVRAEALDPAAGEATQLLRQVRHLIASRAIQSGDLNLAAMYVAALGGGAARSDPAAAALSRRLDAEWLRTDPGRNVELRRLATAFAALPVLTTAWYTAAVFAWAESGRTAGVVLGAVGGLGVAVQIGLQLSLGLARRGDERGLLRAVLVNYFGTITSLLTLNPVAVPVHLWAARHLSSLGTLKLAWRAERQMKERTT